MSLKLVFEKQTSILLGSFNFLSYSSMLKYIYLCVCLCVYVCVSASLSANLLGPYLWILGHIHKLKSNPPGWWLEYFTFSEWWWCNSLDWSMIHWLLETTAVGWWSCFFFLVNQETIWGLRCNIVSWGEILYCLLDPQTFISHLLWASIYKDTDSDCSREIKTLFLG